MSEEYEVRWFKDEDIPSFINGLNEELWDEYDEKVFEWKFREDPFNMGFTPIVVVEHKTTGERAAFNSFLPLQIRRGGDIFLALQGCDGFVRRGHRRRGLFQATLKFLAEEIKGERPEILIGFNLAEAAGAARKAGSEAAFSVNKFIAEASKLNKDAEGTCVTLEPIDLLEYSDLYEEWATRSLMLHFHRPLPYLTWRVRRHPFRVSHPYRVLVREEIIGYVVVDIVKENDGLAMTLNDYTPRMLENHLSDVISRLLDMYPNVSTMEFVAKNGTKLAFKASENGFKTMPWYKVIMMALNNTNQGDGGVFRKGINISDGRRWFITSSDVY